MKMPWQDKTGLAQAAAIFATILGISIGLCGLNFIGVSALGGTKGLEGPLVITAYLEALLIILSIVGLLVIAVIAIILAIFRRSNTQ